jgi:hypothetical protein
MKIEFKKKIIDLCQTLISLKEEKNKFNLSLSINILLLAMRTNNANNFHRKDKFGI